MSASEIDRTLVRLAHQIVEKTNASERLALVGIKRRGVPLAERLATLVSGIVKRPVETGVLDIQFYRDDLSTHGVRPVVNVADIGLDVNGRDVILCDDVLLYRAHHPRRPRRAFRSWPAPLRATRRADRSRPSRASHRSHLRRQARAHQQPGNHRSQISRGRQRRAGSARGKSRLTGYCSNHRPGLDIHAA